MGTYLTEDKVRLLSYYDKLEDREKGEIIGEVKEMARREQECRKRRSEIKLLHFNNAEKEEKV